jgi:hypothetical protein
MSPQEIGGGEALSSLSLHFFKSQKTMATIYDKTQFWIG